MPLGRRQRVATVGAAVVATALSLAACSSSSSSSTPASSGSAPPRAAHPRRSGAALSGTLNGSGSTFQTTFQETAISSFKSVQSGMTVNYGSGGSGKGRTDLASGVVNFAGSDSPIPAAETANFKGKTVLYFPVVIGPITLSYNLSGLSKPLQLSAPVIAEHLPGQDHEAGTTRRSRRTTPVSRCPAPRSPSSSAPTPRARPRTSPCSSWTPRQAPGRSAAARPSSGPPRPAPATATAGWRRSSSPPPGPSGTWTTPTPRPPG